jgi:hypothetical protein
MLPTHRPEHWSLLFRRYLKKVGNKPEFRMPILSDEELEVNLVDLYTTCLPWLCHACGR